MTSNGAMISVPMSSGPAAEAYLARPDDDAHPGVLLFSDAFGVREQIRTMADTIASWGYIVLAPNVFYRSGSIEETTSDRDLHEPGVVADFFPAAKARIATLTPGRILDDVDDYVTALTDLAGVTTPIGVTGYCMGARMALRAACARPDVIAACGGFHGGGLATEAEDSPHLGLPSARAEFVFGNADNDGSMSAADVARLEAALVSAGVRHRNEIVSGAPHGYTMADTPMYDQSGATWHDRELQSLLARALPVN